MLDHSVGVVRRPEPPFPPAHSKLSETAQPPMSLGTVMEERAKAQLVLQRVRIEATEKTAGLSNSKSQNP